MDIEKAILKLCDLKKGNKELAIFFDPERECPWCIMLGNPSDSVLLGEVPGDYSAAGTTFEEAFASIHADLVLTTTMTIDPDPPKAGQSLLVCTDGTLPKVVEINWVPPGLSPAKITLKEPCASFTVPDGASSINLHDTSGECPDVSRGVVQ